MSENNKLKIGITFGDVNGIGIEVILKTFQNKKILEYCTPVLYGSSKAVSYYRKALKIENIHYNITSGIDKLHANNLNILNLWDEEINIMIGEMKEEAAKYALESLDACANDLLAGKIDGMVTAPVNKHVIQQVHSGFRGQTEFLANKTKSSESLMLLVNDDLRVGLVCNHVPLREVSAYISEENIMKKIKVLHQTLKKDFLINKPRIAVLGLNPHAGDEGSIGTEEQEILIPVLKRVRDEENILAFGPYPGDGFFGAHSYSSFDGILAMYHDQGLIPFKALSFGQGVNYTAGLPIVRTSPDHGTAYNIAGKGEAREDSFRKAIFTCLDIIRNRIRHDQMHKDPLKPQVAGHEKK